MWRTRVNRGLNLKLRRNFCAPSLNIKSLFNIAEEIRRFVSSFLRRIVFTNYQGVSFYPPVRDSF